MLSLDEQDFRRLFDTVDDMVVLWTPDGRIVQANSAACHKLGYRPEDLTSLYFPDLHPGEKRTESEAILAAMLRGERDTCSLPLVSKAGKRIPAETRIWRVTWNGLDCFIGMSKGFASEHEAEQEYESIFRKNPALMAISALPDGKFIDVNDAFLALLGYSRDKVIGKTSVDLGLFVHPEQYDAILEKVRLLGHITDFELQVRRGDGSILDGLLSGEVLSSRGEQRLLFVIVDISVQKLTEQMVRDERQRLESIIRGMNVGTWEWNIRTGETIVSDRWAEIVGYTPDELPFLNIRSWEGLYHPRDIKKSNDLLERHFSGELPFYDCHLRMRHKAGHWVWVQDRGQVVTRTENGEPLLMFGTHADITEIKRTEEMLREKSEELDRYFTSSLDLLCIADVSGRFIRLNPEWERVLGYPVVELEGRMFLDFVHPEDLESTLAAISRLGGQERVFNFENRYRCKDGSYRWIEWRSSPQGNLIYAVARDITEKKNTIKALQVSEARYRGLVESQYDLIVRVSPEGVFTFVNDAYCRKFGKKRDELVGNSFVPLVHDDDIGPTLQAMKALESPPYRVYIEQRAMTVEGWRWLAWEDYAIRDETGKTVEIQAIGRDITERKNAEIALLESQQKYRSVFDKANDLMALIDSRGNIVEINERMRNTFGYDTGELVGKNLADLPILSGTERIRAVSLFQKRLSGESVNKYELTFCKKDGTDLTGEVNATLIEFPGGEKFDLKVIRDITERKKAEEDRLLLINKLNETTNELNTILDSVGDAIVSMDTSRVITSVNRAFTLMLGVPEEQIIGKRCDEVIGCFDEHGVSICKDGCNLATTLSGVTRTADRSVIRNAEGTNITVSSINSPLISATGSVIGVVKSIRDISKEAEIERLKNEFVATVSHELRTPLTSIQGFIDLILEGDTGKVTPQQREFLEIALQNADRLTAIISDLLDIERIETGRISLVKKRVPLHHLADQVARSMLPMAQEKGLEFTITVEKDIEIEADPDRIQQIFSNLITNAIKFTPSGSVTVDIRLVGRRVVMSFRDTGIGIKEKDIPNLFTRFFRAKDARERNISGTGLGLSIVKSLVEMHGGAITVHSTPGSGSEFIVILPARGSKGENDR